MMAVLFLMVLRSTVFSPAKYGIIPEMLPEKDGAPRERFKLEDAYRPS